MGGDTSPLNKAMSEINSKTKDLQSELKQVDNLLKLDPGNIVLLEQKQSLLSKSIENTSEKLKTLKDAQSEVNEQFSAGKINEEQYRAFQREIAATEGALNKLKSSTEDNNSALNKSSNEFGDAEKKATSFTNELKKSGNEATDSSGKFEKLGSVLGGIGTAFAAGVATIGAAAGTAIASISKMAVESGAYADNMLTLSIQTGLSTDSLQAFQYASELVDVSMETLTGSMAKNIKGMSEAASGTEKYSEAYKKLGVNVKNSDGSLRNSEDVYYEVIDALGTVANETERNALAMEIFGKSAQDLNPLIVTGSEGLKALTAEAEAMGAVLSSEQLASMGGFDDTIQRLSSGADMAKIALGNVLMPQLQELGGVGVELLGNFTSGLNAANGDMGKISEVIGNTVGSAISIIMEKLPEFLNYGIEIVSSITGAITENLPSLISAVTDIAMTIIGKLIDSLPDILKMGVDILLELVNGITQALPDLIPAAVNAIMTIVQGLIDNLPDILGAALDIILALAEGILTALPELIKALPAIITGLVEFLIGAIPQIIEAGITLLISLVEALPEIIDAIVKAIPLIITGIINALTENIDKIIDAGVTLFIALVDNLPKIIVELVKAIPKIITSIVTAFTDNFDKIKEVGTNLITGLWNGIEDSGKWLWEKISSFFGGIVDGIKDFFGIASPSKLFENEIGNNLALGIGKGFEKSMSKVSNDMKNALPSGSDLFKLENISMPKRSSIAYLDSNNSNNGSSNNQNNFKIEKLVDITFGDVNQDTLPEVKKILKDIPEMVTKSLNEKLSARGVKNGALARSI